MLSFLRTNFLSLVFTTLFFAFSTNSAFAHVTLVQPDSGDVLDGGSSFTIKWIIDEEVAPDENWDIRFSRDNGASWEVVAKNLRSTVRQFNWNVPNINTSQGRIEVIEDFPSGADDGARSGAFTIVKVKPFAFNCETDFGQWILGLERLAMETGDTQSCVLKLSNSQFGVPVEILTKAKGRGSDFLDISPINGVTDENGEVVFNITATQPGIGWVAWGIPNERGQFKFNKKSYDAGNAWGMFIDVE